MNFGLARFLLIPLLVGTAGAPAFAQASHDVPIHAPLLAAAGQVDQDRLGEGEDGGADQSLLVTGVRLKGAVPGRIRPDLELDWQEIGGYGAGSVEELLEALGPQTQSARGAAGPVVLLNGRRISSFAEIRDIPPEALERVEILPEEAALQYGYRAGQRVVNFVLRSRYHAVTAEVQSGHFTQGGRDTQSAELNYLRVNSRGRLNIGAEYRRAGALLESERSLVQGSQDGFDLLGNIAGAPIGGEIDPALSALAGRPVTIAAVPSSAAMTSPVLKDFAAGAGAPNLTSIDRYRTLLPATEQFELSGTFSRTLFGNVEAVVNATIDGDRSRSRLGLASASLVLPQDNPFSPFGRDVSLLRFFGAPDALIRRSNGWNGHIGATLSGDLRKSWTWSVTANLDRSSSVTETETGVDVTRLQERLSAGDQALNPFSSRAADLVTLISDRAKARTQGANVETLLSGPIFSLPAGPVLASVNLAAERQGLASEGPPSIVSREQNLHRKRIHAQLSFDLPILRPGGFGSLNANINGRIEHVSDFGTVTSLGYGVNWTPAEAINFSANLTHEEGVASVQQLAAPLIATPSVRVLDFVRGETVDIVRFDGGNPALLADDRRVFSLAARIRPLSGSDLTVTANYVDIRIDDAINSFPAATREIEAAFPARFRRDPQGRLLSIDARPVNFARAEREELRSGITYSRPIGSEAPSAAERRRLEALASDGGPQPSGRRRRPAQRSPSFGARGRLQLSLHHSWRFRDTILIRPGLAPLDLLNGSAAGSAGGRPRHTLDFIGGISGNNMGARVTVNWQQNSFVRGSAGGTGDLFFAQPVRINLRLFADLAGRDRLVQAVPSLEGARLSIGINNLLDSRPRVRDASGETPLAYQAAYLDPLGRSVTIAVRKQFF